MAGERARRGTGQDNPMPGFKGLYLLSWLGLCVFSALPAGAETPQAAGMADAPAPDGDTGFRWGVNGHPIRAAYGTLSMAQQLDLMKDIGISSYRVDVYILDQMDTLDQLVSQALPRGIEILPMLQPELGSDEESSYDIGLGFGKAFAERFRSSIRFWELGNEWENWVGVWLDGSRPSRYNTKRYNIVRGMIRGLLDGIHAGDPNSKGIVGNAGWCHYGFQQRLLDDGVNFDITGVHWYSDQGSLLKAGCGNRNILAILARWGKPIWLTEFNTREETEQDEWLVATMSEVQSVKATYRVERMHIYQLLDEPHLSGHEATYGLAKADGTPKPAFHAVRKFIANLAR
jgi:hypothetical protein